MKFFTDEYKKAKLKYAFSNTTITESGCMEWQGGTNGKGYGKFCVCGKPDYAHRNIWRLVFGEIPEGIYILHKCDNRICINPYHLFLGTPKDNMEDKVKKGRHNSFSKLTKEVINNIIELILVNKIPYAQIAVDFGVTPQYISKIACKNGIHKRLSKTERLI